MIFSIRVVVSKEKKGKTKKEIKKAIIKSSSKSTTNIVLSIGKDRHITKYNIECERIFGYNKKEAINQPIFNFLIPTKFKNEWKEKFDSLENNKKIDDFNLPLLDKQGQEVLISWSVFPVKNVHGTLIDINLVGNLISSLYEEKEPLIEFPKIETKEKLDKTLIKENTIEKKSENYNELKKMIKILKRKNSELDKKNKDLEKNLDFFKNRVEILKKKKSKKKSKKDAHEDYQSFSDLVENKLDNQDYENIMNELDDREKLLKNLENDLMKDKSNINEQANEFKKWRKKLENLEIDINNREKELLTKERLLTDKIVTSEDITSDFNKGGKVVKYHDLLDKIPDSAVVIHRGILKQVNDSFANLIGYKIDEILNKSLFDFIIAEELSDVKDFYINRLMGVDVSNFETTLLTKNNDEILVEVNTKPTDFNGKKAEIAIIKTIKTKKEEK